MNIKPMRILIIEDDIDDCNDAINAAKIRNDVEIIAATDSDVAGLNYVKTKRPEGIILDIELNKSRSGSIDAFDFLDNIKKLKLNYEPIIIVTTHINSDKTYELLHKKGVEMIFYKEQTNYSINKVFNRFLDYRMDSRNDEVDSIQETLKNEKEIFSEYIDKELEKVGITSNLKGRKYLHDAILYIVQNEANGNNVVQYLSNITGKAKTTITNGMENAINKGWSIIPPEELEQYYTAKIDHRRGAPTTMEFIYYYVEKVKKNA